MSGEILGLDDVERARDRIEGEVRRTPCLRARFFKTPAVDGADLTLKLECLQVSGSFKARGASNKVLSLSDAERARGLVTASGGNHGLGVAYAGWRAGAPVTVYLPETTPAHKKEKLEQWGAQVVLAGTIWDEANAAARAAELREGTTYVHPFADPAVMAGQGTVALEILKQAPDTDTVLIAIGGGGLISGMATALKGVRRGVKVIGVEPVGAPTLRASVDAGRVVALEFVNTAANTLAAGQTDPANLALVQRHVDDIVLVDDREMRDAARWLWFEMGLGVELSAAAALAALRTGRYRPDPGENVCALVCGAGTDGIV